MVLVLVFLLPLLVIAAGGARPPPVPSARARPVSPLDQFVRQFFPATAASSSSSRNDVYSANKRALLAAIASARAGGGSDRATILSCVAALESQYAETQRPGRQQQKQRPNACAAGKWSLVYSTKERASSTSEASTKSAVDQLSAQAYNVFFKFAPFLAGGQDTAAAAAAAIAPPAKTDGLPKKLRLAVSNTQEVDLAAGRALNTVTVAAPALTRWRLRIVVAGDVNEAVDGATGAPSPDVLAVTFTNFLVEFLSPPVRRTAEAADGDDAIAAAAVDTMTTPAWTLALPLPRPTGSLRTTFCDSDLRVSRGGQGGVFVVKRIP